LAALAESDDAKVRQAAVSVGVAVAAASGAVVFLGCLILIIIMMASAREVSSVTVIQEGRWGAGGPPRWGILDARSVIGALAVLAILSLALTSLVAWFMARRAVRPLADALQLQRHFVADASHELRTPLTALSSRVQILGRRLDSGKPIDDVVAQLYNDTATMRRVLDDMLLTVEGAPDTRGMRTPVVACLRQAVGTLDALAEQGGVNLLLTATSDMAVAVPETSLTRAVVAIVDNAIQHSPSGTQIMISAVTSENTAIVRVSDQGKGILGVDPQRVFDRFSHGQEPGRKRSFGLGLALASEVANRFGGDIRVEATSSRGTTFALGFPLAV
jgi:signal transduction histidine kinase